MADNTYTTVTAEQVIQNSKPVENSPPSVLNVDDKPLTGNPTISILASGNANVRETGLKKSNDTVVHVCNMPMIVMRAINMAGAMGGQIVMAIRKAIKEVLAALNINPSGNGIVSYLKKIANYIKDMTKFVKDITKFVNGLVIYVNMIKQLIQYILSLPAKLIEFFKDCLQQAYAELKKGYLDAISSVAGTGDSSSETIAAAKDVMNQTAELINASGVLVSTTASVAGSLTTLDITGPTANTAQLNQAVTEVFSAAGYGPNDPSKYGKA